jgi:hypothetical protein
MLASADNADLIMEMSKDAGATWERAHYNVGGTAVNPKGGTISLPSDVDAAAAHLYLAMDNAAGSQNGGQLDFLSLRSSGTYKPFHGWCIGFYHADHQAWPGSLMAILGSSHPSTVSTAVRRPNDNKSAHHHASQGQPDWHPQIGFRYSLLARFRP